MIMRWFIFYFFIAESDIRKDERNIVRDNAAAVEHEGEVQ